MWVNDHGVQRWLGEPFPEPADQELAAYAHTVVLVEERQHPSCGRPGTGRKVHRKRGESSCLVCDRAEAEYARRRREVAAAEAEGARIVERAAEQRVAWARALSDRSQLGDVVDFLGDYARPVSA